MLTSQEENTSCTLMLARESAESTSELVNLRKTLGKTKLRSAQADIARNDQDKRDCGNLRVTLLLRNASLRRSEKPQHFLWMMVSQICRALLSRSTSAVCCGRQDGSFNLYRSILVLSALSTHSSESQGTIPHNAVAPKTRAYDGMNSEALLWTWE